MTNTYEDNTPIDEKAKEELRLIRCLLERLLRSLNETNFVDYQMEKFGDKLKGDTFQDNQISPKTENISQNNDSQREISRPKQEKRIRPLFDIDFKSTDLDCECDCHNEERYWRDIYNEM